MEALHLAIVLQQLAHLRGGGSGGEEERGEEGQASRRAAGRRGAGARRSLSSAQARRCAPINGPKQTCASGMLRVILAMKSCKGGK